MSKSNSLLDVANKECLRLRMEKHPCTAPELFPDPPIQSNQVKGALFAVEQALAKFEKQLAALKKAAKRPPKKATKLSPYSRGPVL